MRLKIVHAKGKADLEMLRELDKQGRLVHGDSYPTVEQLAISEDKTEESKFFLQSEMKGCI